MAILTEPQSELLKWIVESGSGEALFIETSGPQAIVIIADGGPRQEVAPPDFRELVEQGLFRYVRGQMYEVTNEGRLAYARLTEPPPPERPSVGFKP